MTIAFLGVGREVAKPGTLDKTLGSDELTHLYLDLVWRLHQGTTHPIVWEGKALDVQGLAVDLSRISSVSLVD